MSMLKSPQARTCCLFSIIDSTLSQTSHADWNGAAEEQYKQPQARKGRKHPTPTATHNDLAPEEEVAH